MNDNSQARVCVPVCGRSVSDTVQAFERATGVADIIEIRLDCLEPLELEKSSGAIAELLGRSVAPTIITFRPAEQGGRRELPLASRHAFWCSSNYPLGTSFFDVELDLVRDFSSRNGEPPLAWQRIICSHHDFVGVPADLEQIYEQMAGTAARILKIAVLANDVTDCLPVFRLLERAGQEGREMIAIAMGTAGYVTRILGPSRGSFLTYGALSAEEGTAPGQIDAKELRNLYRINQINRQTQVTGIIGWPVSHSVSPYIHNAAFEATAMDAVYIPFEVRDAGEFMKRMVHPRTREFDWNLRGLSVTAPHKSAVMGQLDWIEAAAKEIGAVNTVVVEGERLNGYNTDAAAVLVPLRDKLGSLHTARCAIVGAGGAAMATAWSLKQEGADVTVFARRVEQADSIANRFSTSGKSLAGAQFGEFDLVINATPLGTRGGGENVTPVTADQLRGAHLAYDLVYNPSETRFMREARQAGCEAIGGLPMLVAQAVEQFKLWTCVEPPTAVMHAAALAALKA